MSELLLGTAPVLRARVSVPRVGVWHAEVTLDTDEPVTGTQTLRTADDSLTLTGHVRSERSATFEGYTDVLLVGGADGLSQTLPAKYYRNAPVSVILADLCAETGEVLSSTVDSALLSNTFGAWVRPIGSGGDALASLVSLLGVSWRILSDGTLWLGAETWPNVDAPGELVSSRPIEAQDELSVETLYGLIAPGTTFDGRRVSYVEHRADGTEFSTRIMYEPAPGTVAPPEPVRDRIKSGLDALVRNVLTGARYQALFPATVLSQAADGTLDLALAAPSMPQLTAVPIRNSSPGRRVNVQPGAQCLVAFEGAAPSSPVVIAWTGADGRTTTVTEDCTEFKIGTGATRGIARANDTVAVDATFKTWLDSVGTAAGPGPFPGTTIGTISSASSRGKCD